MPTNNPHLVNLFRFYYLGLIFDLNDLAISQESHWQKCFDQDRGCCHVHQVLVEHLKPTHICYMHLILQVSHLCLQVGQVRDDDDDEEVDHGDGAQDDHDQQEEHGKASADPITAKSLIELSKVELPEHHGEAGHPTLKRVLEHVAVQPKAQHHEGKGKASNHEAHGNHIPVC